MHMKVCSVCHNFQHTHHVWTPHMNVLCVHAHGCVRGQMDACVLFCCDQFNFMLQSIHRVCTTTGNPKPSSCMPKYTRGWGEQRSRQWFIRWASTASSTSCRWHTAIGKQCQVLVYLCSFCNCRCLWSGFPVNWHKDFVVLHFLVIYDLKSLSTSRLVARFYLGRNHWVCAGSEDVNWPFL